MNDKDMLNDYLAMIKGSLATYANVIAENSDSQLRSTFQQMRNQDEQRQYQIAQTSLQKGYISNTITPKRIVDRNTVASGGIIWSCRK